MRRLTAFFLVIAMIGTTVIWMPYSYSHGELDSHLTENGATQPVDSHTESDCDHCCHVSSHVVAIVFPLIDISANHVSADYPKAETNILSYDTAPPGRPPKHLV